MFHSLTDFNLSILQSRGINGPHPGYREPHPSELQLVSAITNSLPKSKSKCIQNDLRHLQETISSAVNSKYGAAYFTDGSVDPRSGRAGAAFLFEDEDHAQRLSDNSTTLQAELFAIVCPQSCHRPSRHLYLYLHTH